MVILAITLSGVNKMTTQTSDNYTALLKSELKKARVEKSNNYLRVSSKRDDIDMSKLLSADNASEFEDYFNTL